jgi:hypothetical protein
MNRRQRNQEVVELEIKHRNRQEVVELEKKHRKRRAVVALLASIMTLGGAIAQAQDDKGGGDLRSAVQNPISSLISLPFKFQFDYGADNGEASFLNIQPVLPVTVGDWNLVNRIIMPLIDTPGQITGTPEMPTPIQGKGATGLGDINYSLFLSPVKTGKVIWGVGPSISLPTATDKQLGSEKWSAGPTAVFLTQPKWGSMGILMRQLWSFAGDSDRNEVSQFLVEPFVNYNLDKGWFLISDMVATANWRADSGNQWTVPLGGGIGRVFKVGNQPINSRVEAYYNVVRPDGAPDWQIAFTWQFLFPK